jgi:hypothetical protein
VEKRQQRLSGPYPPDRQGTPGPTELETHHAPELEIELLRHGIQAMAADRGRCVECSRSPLVGERLLVFISGDGGERRVCELCLKAFPHGSLGEPIRIERVRAAERPLNVRAAA